MESDGSLPRSQQPATSPYPKPDQSSPYLILIPEERWARRVLRLRMEDYIE